MVKEIDISQNLALLAAYGERPREHGIPEGHLVRRSEPAPPRDGSTIPDCRPRASCGSWGFEVHNVLGAGHLVVDRNVIVETKVAKAIDPVHRAQVSNYLRASGLEVGLVMNFGSSVQFKRVVASPHRAREATKN